jgi:hypothetical protein
MIITTHNIRTRNIKLKIEIWSGRTDVESLLMKELTEEDKFFTEGI